MSLASPTAEWVFEATQFYFRRAGGMTGKDEALRIAGSLACPMPFVARNKTPRESGNYED
jgi:hypothetical protein